MFNVISLFEKKLFHNAHLKLNEVFHENGCLKVINKKPFYEILQSYTYIQYVWLNILIGGHAKETDIETDMN